MAYVSPAGTVAHFVFQEPVAYTPPAGTDTDWEYVRFVSIDGEDFSAFGLPVFTFPGTAGTQYITLTGTDFAIVWDEYSLYDALGYREGFRYVNEPLELQGTDFSAFGIPTVSN